MTNSTTDFLSPADIQETLQPLLRIMTFSGDPYLEMNALVINNIFFGAIKMTASLADALVKQGIGIEETESKVKDAFDLAARKFAVDDVHTIIQTLATGFENQYPEIRKIALTVDAALLDKFSRPEMPAPGPLGGPSAGPANG